MTEKEKMVAGLWHRANDPGLIQERKSAESLLFELQQLHPSKEKERVQRLRQLFGKSGPNIWVELPFSCDYGSNISVGNHFYANHNCVILDCAPVTIGDHVMLGPQVGIYTVNHPLDFLQREQGWERALPITIGSHVWIGGGSLILPGVTIGDHTVIGAGALLPETFRPTWWPLAIPVGF